MSEPLKPLNGHEERLIRAAGDTNFITVQRLILTMDHDRKVYEQARDAYQATIRDLHEQIRTLSERLGEVPNIRG